jgi:hypothetical protein
MAKRIYAMGVQFNDNDGTAGFFYDSAGLYDHDRHIQVYGKWRTRLKFLNICLQAIILSEESCDRLRPYRKDPRGL